MHVRANKSARGPVIRETDKVHGYPIARVYWILGKFSTWRLDSVAAVSLDIGLESNADLQGYDSYFTHLVGKTRI